MAPSSFKNRVWEMQEHPVAGDRLSRLFDLSMIAVILISVAGVTLRTVPSMVADHPLVLRAIEFGSVSIFTIEIFLRLWVADLGRRGASSSLRLTYLRSAASMFFVADGTLEVEIDGHQARLKTEFFGEIALLEGGMRSATIRSLTRCQLLVLYVNHFEKLLAASPRIERAVRTVARDRGDADERRGSAPGGNRDDPTE